MRCVEARNPHMECTSRCVFVKNLFMLAAQSSGLQLASI